MSGIREAVASSEKRLARFIDPWASALRKLQQLKTGQWLRVRDVAKKDPELFKQIVKQLIRAGWCEYEFNDGYTEIRRLDLPDYARDYFSSKSVGKADRVD